MKIVLIKIAFTLLLVLPYSNLTAQPGQSLVDASDSSSVEIYVIKNYWHTGIVLPVNDNTEKLVPVLQKFDDYAFVDIGFGDRVFYMDPDYDLALAARAILLPTESTVRIAGAGDSVEAKINRSDYSLKIILRENELFRLCRFIDSTLAKPDKSDYSVLENKYDGAVVFFESLPKYHLFNTCNTWVAEALKFAGLDYLKPQNVVTSQDLYKQLIMSAEILKEASGESFF